MNKYYQTSKIQDHLYLNSLITEYNNSRALTKQLNYVLRKAFLLATISILFGSELQAKQWIIFHATKPSGISNFGHAFASFIQEDLFQKQPKIVGCWGFYPKEKSAQAIWGGVEGELRNDWQTNQDYSLLVEVSNVEFNECLRIKELYRTRFEYSLIGKNCVDFIRDLIAAIPRLQPPNKVFAYPDEMVRELKRLNNKTESESIISFENSIGNLTNTAEKGAYNFTYEESNQPYNYHKLWGVNYFRANDKFQAVDTTQMRIIANLPSPLKLQWVNFDRGKIYPLTSDKVQSYTYGNDVGAPNITQKETKVSGFPLSLLKININDRLPKGSVVIQTDKELRYQEITTHTITDQNLTKTLSEKIKSLAPKLLRDNPQKNQFEQNNLQKKLNQRIGQILKANLPGLECYLIKLGEFNNIVLISLNGKISLLSSNNYGNSGITFYKLNDNYFISLNGYIMEIFEVRPSGVTREWKSSEF